MSASLFVYTYSLQYVILFYVQLVTTNLKIRHNKCLSVLKINRPDEIDLYIRQTLKNVQ